MQALLRTNSSIPFFIRAKKMGFILPLLWVSPSVLAAEPSVTQLDDVVVTANRVARTVDETITPVTVITQDEIKKYQAVSLMEVLRRVPGLNISNNGGLGKASSFFIRGTNSGHVLVLIDGVRHGSATLGSTAFEHLPVDQIERIEVVRGPRSSLYGSEAIGGVIQIFTRKGIQGFKPSASLSLGSHDTLTGSVNLSGGNKASWYNFNLQSEDTDGIDSCNSTVAGCFADEPDKDGYHRDSVSIHLGHQFNPAVSGEISVLRAMGDTQFDGSFQDEADFVQQVISAKLTADITDRFNLRFNVGQSRDESDNFKTGVFSSRFDTRRDTASLLADIDINDNQSMLLGLDWYNDRVDSTTAYDITQRDNKAIFASYSLQHNQILYDASLRYDDNEQFGGKTTGGIAMGRKLGNGMTLKASYGTAFKAPTFNQLYFPGFGDKNLKPEDSQNIELGISGQWQKGNWEANLFQNNIDNLIAGFPVSNVDEARIRGLELSTSARIGGFDVASNLTLQEPENRTGADAGKLLRERPKQILNLDVDRKLGRWTVGASAHAESERFANGDNSIKLGGFSTFDVRTSYAISKNWHVGLKIANILDKNYETKQGYNQDGVNGLVTVRYTPK